MIYLAFIFAIAGIIVAFLPFSRRGWATAGCFAIGILLFVFSCITTIQPGHVGVPIIFGSVGDNVYTSGMHLRNPFAEIHKISIQEHAYSMTGQAESGTSPHEKPHINDTMSVLTNEGMKVDIDLTVQWRVVGEKVPWILNNKVYNDNDQFEADYVRPEIRRAIRDVCAEYSGQELYSTYRGNVGEEIRNKANALLARNGVVCVAVNMRNVTLPPTVTAAIEKKKEREQQNQEYDYKLQIEQKEAERKRLEAAGIRDFQRIVSEGISEQLIQWKGIEAAEKLASSPNSKVLIFGNTKNPIIIGAQ